MKSEAPVRVLFLCTGNSCRSQMAEGWLRHLGGSGWVAASAGTEPAGLNPRAVQVMAERGVDISGQASKHVEAFRDEPLDRLVTVCGGARESCPSMSGVVRREHWPIEDPAKAEGTEEERLRVFRRVRDEIEERVRRLIR